MSLVEMVGWAMAWSGHRVGHDDDDVLYLCGHGEQGGDAESHPGGHRLGVEPEVHLVKKFLLQQSWI